MSIKLRKAPSSARLFYWRNQCGWAKDCPGKTFRIEEVGEIKLARGSYFDFYPVLDGSSESNAEDGIVPLVRNKFSFTLLFWKAGYFEIL